MTAGAADTAPLSPGSQAALETAAHQGLRVLAPVPKPKDPTRDPALPLASDSPVIAAWRSYMAADAVKATYKLRAATSECVNAQARSQHGLLQLRVRGLVKALAVALWITITHDLWTGHIQTHAARVTITNSHRVQGDSNACL